MTDRHVHMAMRSPPDPRDIILETHPFYTPSHLSTAAPLPDTLDLSSQLKMPRDQGSRGTCVAFATCVIKEYQCKEDIDVSTYMSPEYIYWFRSNKTAQDDNQGMIGRDAMQILEDHGNVPEFQLPYSDPAPNPDIPQSTISSLSSDASNFRIQSYAQVTTIDGVKTALNQYGPCLILFPVYSTRPQFWRQASATDELSGGHGVSIVGYTTEGFIIRNSWGCTWNGDGTVIYPYTDFGAHWEIWSAIDLKSNPIKYVIPPDPISINCLNGTFKKCNIL